MVYVPLPEVYCLTDINSAVTLSHGSSANYKVYPWNLSNVALSQEGIADDLEMLVWGKHSISLTYEVFICDMPNKP